MATFFVPILFSACIFFSTNILHLYFCFVSRPDVEVSLLYGSHSSSSILAKLGAVLFLPVPPGRFVPVELKRQKINLFTT